MRPPAKGHASKFGLSPGSLVYVGAPKTDRVRITVTDFNPKTFEETAANTVEECLPFLNHKDTVTWVHVSGLHEVSIIEQIGNSFGLHSLVMEDILNTGHRPKMEDHEDSIFLVLKVFYLENPEEGRISMEQVSLILGNGFVVSFQESDRGIFEPVRKRLRNAGGRIRVQGADYLAYALLDTVIDHYFGVLEVLGERIESVEERLMEDPSRVRHHEIHQLKREILLLRKSIWPLREVATAIQRSDNPIIRDSTHVFLRDVYDHIVQAIDTIEIFRDMGSGMQDMYLSSLSNRMNEVMKVLTIFATLFIPLTFLAGVYGMNFEYMPELDLVYAYPLFWLVVLAAGGGMAYLFKKKKWL